MSNHVFYNAKVYVQRNEFAQAIWEKDGIIFKVGSNEEVLAVAGEAQKIDCNGRTIIPGLNDSHQHLLYMGSAMLFPDLTKATCAEDLTVMGKEYLRNNPESKGFQATGWNDDTWKDGKHRRPTKEDLDAISTEIPIVFKRVCTHVCCVNSYVLNHLGIDSEHRRFDGAV